MTLPALLLCLWTADPTPESLVEAYAATTRVMMRAQFNARMRVYYLGYAVDSESLIMEKEETVVRFDRTVRLVHKSRTWFPRQPPSTHATEAVYRDQNSVLAILNESNAVDAVVAYLDERPPDRRKRELVEPSAAVFGYLQSNDGNLLPDLLRDSRLTVRADRVDDSDVWLLESRGSWGTHALWLDPKLGYLPVRITQRKSGADRIREGQLLRDLPLQPASVLYPGGKLTHITRELTNLRTTVVKGVHVPIAFRFIDEHQYERGDRVRFRTEVELTDIELFDEMPESRFVLATPIPNGMRVQVNDRENIAYEWRDGQIVKSVDQELIGQLERASFKGSSGLWTAFTAGLIVLVAAIFVHRLYLRNRRGE